MYINVNRPHVDDLIRIKYSESETVENVKDIKHEIAKACLIKSGIIENIEISWFSVQWRRLSHSSWLNSTRGAGGLNLKRKTR